VNNPIDDLRARMAAARGAGQLMIGSAARVNRSSVEVADEVLRTAGALPIGAAWQPIDEARAQSLLRGFLAKDLAYNRRCMSDQQATRFADELLSLVHGPTDFLTNIDQDPWLAVQNGKKLKAVSSAPVTSATLSAAVVVVGPGEAVALIVSDED
jgi:hypothetical protein